MNKTEVSIISISNGNFDIFPENSLTSFKNKLPETFEWRKNGVYRYHLAVESIGVSTNFTSTYLPKKKENPSVILAYPLKFPVELDEDSSLLEKKKPIQSTCVGIDEMPANCNTTILDPISNKEFNQVPNQYGFNYFYLEDENMNIKKYVKFFQSIAENSNNTLKFSYDENTSIINLKSVGMFLEENKRGVMNSVTHLCLHSGMLKNIDISYDAREQPFTPEFFDYRRLLNMYNEDITYNSEEYHRVYLHQGFQSLNLNLSKVSKKHYPLIVKVQCDQIKAQILDSEKSRDILVFHPEIPEKNTFFFHEVERKIYFPLENTILNELRFQLLDENNELLNLNEGIATVIKLRLKKMEYYKKSHNVRLTSRVTDVYKDNTGANFTNVLPETLEFDQNWKVSVATINLPNKFSTLPPGNFVQFGYKTNSGLTKTILFEFDKRNYSKTELLNTLNSYFDKFGDGQKLITFQETMESGAYEKKVSIRLHKEYSGVQISKDLAHLFGYGAENFTSRRDFLDYVEFKVRNFNPGSTYKEIHMSIPMNITYFLPSYTILYSDIVKPTIIGGNYANILKIFPIHSNDDDYVIHQFKDPEFFPLQNNEIKNISVLFKNHAGETLNFANNNIVIVDLVFSNY